MHAQLGCLTTEEGSKHRVEKPSRASTLLRSHSPMAERSSETKFTCYSSREMVENPSEFADKVASLLDITIPSHIDVNNIIESYHSKSSDGGDYRHPDLQNFNESRH